MRYWLILLQLTLFCTAIRADFNDDIPPDKAAHFAISYGIALTGAQICKKLWPDSNLDDRRWFCPIASGLIAVIPGLVKEMQDPVVDYGDVRANLYGIGTATLLNIAIDF